MVLIVQATGQTNGDKDAAYTKTITQRADKIIVPLAIADSAIANKVRNIIVQQYRNLNDIYTERDTKLTAAKELKETNKMLSDEQIKNTTNEVNARLYILHFAYISKLMLYLTLQQLEQVKDGMTYGVLPLTYKAYCDMVLNLTDEQKLQIKVWLTEARELSMDAGSSDEKHKWFGKYKGRINNYLSQAGYNMKLEGEEWQKRIKSTTK
jgi:hypothetical protein